MVITKIDFNFLNAVKLEREQLVTLANLLQNFQSDWDHEARKLSWHDDPVVLTFEHLFWFERWKVVVKITPSRLPHTISLESVEIEEMPWVEEDEDF